MHVGIEFRKDKRNPSHSKHWLLLTRKKMKIFHYKTLLSSHAETRHPFKSRITSLSFSPDNERLAIVTSDRVVSIFDSKGDQVDKFNTKANNNGPKNYIVR